MILPWGCEGSGPSPPRWRCPSGLPSTGPSSCWRAPPGSCSRPPGSRAGGRRAPCPPWPAGPPGWTPPGPAWPAQTRRRTPCRPASRSASADPSCRSSRSPRRCGRPSHWSGLSWAPANIRMTNVPQSAGGHSLPRSAGCCDINTPKWWC